MRFFFLSVFEDDKNVATLGAKPITSATKALTKELIPPGRGPKIITQAVTTVQSGSISFTCQPAKCEWKNQIKFISSLGTKLELQLLIKTA